MENDEAKTKKPTKKTTTEKSSKKSSKKKPLPADRWWLVHEADGRIDCVIFTTSTKKIDHLKDVRTVAWYEDTNGTGIWAVQYKVDVDSFDLETLKELLELTSDHRAIEYEIPRPKNK